MLSYTTTDSGASPCAQGETSDGRHPWFKGVHIAPEIWRRPDLTVFEKCLTSFLRRYPFASSHEIADLCGTTRSNVASVLSALRGKGVDVSRAKLPPERVVAALRGGDMLREPLMCEWCSSLVHSLHEHHFPIPRRKGGKDVVRICGTCHSDYHSLTGE